jgi:DNA invertase Pin-like site-specific DNA recombinase
VIRYTRTADDDQSAFSESLQSVAAGEASVLVVEQLRDARESLRALVGVIDWLESVGAELVAEDVCLDTASAKGQYAVSVLREVGSWERHRPVGGRRGAGRDCIAMRRN